jgi:hypothetical protein
MVKGLESRSGEAEQLMEGVIEKTAYPGPAQSRGFSLEIKHMTHYPGFPVQLAVAPWI